MILRKSISCVSLIILSIVSKAQYFNNNYEICGDTEFYASSVYYDSSIYVAGNWFRINDIGTLFAKIDLNGDTIFTKKYIKDSCRYGTGIGVTLIEKNNYLYSIASYRKPPSYQYKAGIYKLNIYGDTIYFHELDTLNGVFYHSLAFTRDGNIIITGNGNTISTNYNVLLVKMDTLLNPLWITSYGGSNEDVGISVDTTSDNGFVIGGYTQSYGAGLRDAYLIKTDSAGNFQWQKTYGGIYYELGKVKGIKPNEIIFYGNRELNNVSLPSDSDRELFIKKYDNSGTLIFQNLSIVHLPVLEPISILVDGFNFYFNYYYYDIDSSTVFTSIIKTDTSGSVLYKRNYSKSKQDNYSTNMIMLPDKSLVTSGYLFPDGISVMTEDAWLFRVDSMGCFISGCTLGEEEISMMDFNFHVYPNPTNENITFNFSDLENEKVSLIICNSFGKIVNSYSNIISGCKISFSEFSSGIYFLSLRTESGLFGFEKIVYEK